MSIIQGHAKSSGVSEFYPTTINQSLRFEDGDTAYLNWTPASAGNRKTWTWSAWIKRGNIPNDTSQFTFLSAGASGGDTIMFSDGNKFTVNIGLLGINAGVIPANVQRDASSWYHFVASIDTTQATAANRVKMWVNGVQITDFTTTNYPSQNQDSTINSTTTHNIGRQTTYGNYFDGYMAEVHFTDGTAYDADDFGELKSGIWVPKAPSVTYGTNGFYLPFNEDTTVEGFNTVTYTGKNGSRSVEGVGFEPDFVWIKDRSTTNFHVLFDSVRGGGNYLNSNATTAETDGTANYGYISSFDSNGFSLASGSLGDDNVNNLNNDYVAWCWDAGSGSPVSNTDGSITSTVKANTAYGFSVVTYTGNDAIATVGHGLSSAPDVILTKNRDAVTSWRVYHSGTDATAPEDYHMDLDGMIARTSTGTWNSTAPTSSVFTVNAQNEVNGNATDHVAYCFHSVSGYSDFGSYTGNGSSTGPTITTGFKPAFVMVKSASTNDGGNGNWIMYDNTRSPSVSSITQRLYADLSNAEGTNALYDIEFTDTGFQLKDGTANIGSNTNGTTYIYMAFADTRDAAFWLDESGNDNDWTHNNLEHSDVVPDSPTNNFATFNSTQISINTPTFSEGNLKHSCGAAYTSAYSSISPTSGKWYAEVYKSTSTVNCYLGIQLGVDGIDWDSSSESRTGTILYYADGRKRIDGSMTSYGASYTTGDVIGIAVDFDSEEITFYKNGSSQGALAFSASSGDASAATFISFIYNQNVIANFGQDSTFAGNKTAGGNSDANGIGDFAYAPPSGYLALCTSNLPDPVIDPAQDATPEDHFDVLASAGTSSYSGLSFAPDFLWNKIRTAVGSHVVADSVRGDDKRLRVESTEAESTLSGYFNLTSNGFTTTYYNSGGEDYVYYFWKAGGTGVSNTDGSITSTVSANTDAGFSIVGYTGAGGTATVGHGLSSAPEMIIVKRREVSGEQWVVWVAPIHLINTDGYLELNTTNADGNNGNIFTTTAPTASVFSIGNSPETNSSGLDYISYCFHSVDGYSKVGSYVGNGSADGPFVYTGFRPKWVMIKVSSSAGQNWVIYDSERNAYNVMGKQIYPNLTSAEADAGTNPSFAILDFTSNGFKLRGSHSSTNYSTRTIIYLAFAEQPFKYSNAR
jgi:hypothetical protein